MTCGICVQLQKYLIARREARGGRKVVGKSKSTRSGEFIRLDGSADSALLILFNHLEPLLAPTFHGVMMGGATACLCSDDYKRMAGQTMNAVVNVMMTAARTYPQVVTEPGRLPPAELFRFVGVEAAVDLQTQVATCTRNPCTAEVRLARCTRSVRAFASPAGLCGHVNFSLGSRRADANPDMEPAHGSSAPRGGRRGGGCWCTPGAGGAL